MPRYRVLHGDALDLLTDQPDRSVDSIVTDPPYGLAFMGKQWDRALPDPRVWAECLRVATVGSHMLVHGHPRAFHRLAVDVEDTGWQLRDTLCWLFGQGMPKHRSLLKPAWEPILLFRKGSKGGLPGIEACRIPAPEGDREDYGLDHGAPAPGMTGEVYGSWEGARRTSYRRPEGGRHPANAVLDEDVAIALGSHARFFYCAKATKRERNAGLEQPNHHPTVKPVELTRWLVQLVTPPGGIVLDPFCGSGTTGIAAVLGGCRFTGCELDRQAVELARARIAHWAGCG